VLVQPKPWQVDKTMRLDRVLVPTDRILGWKCGPIGVELKRSGIKLGPPIAQLGDYSRSIWMLPNNWNVWLTYLFLWPAPKIGSIAGSHLAQQRLGTARGHGYQRLKFASGEIVLLTWDHGITHIHASVAGQRAGSR
jgi:hypothetical protein